jgi:hypothetical protein
MSGRHDREAKEHTFFAATLIAAALSSQAQPANPPPVTGLYASLGAGANILMDEHLVNSMDTAAYAKLRPASDLRWWRRWATVLAMGSDWNSKGTTTTTAFRSAGILAFRPLLVATK